VLKSVCFCVRNVVARAAGLDFSTGTIIRANYFAPQLHCVVIKKHLYCQETQVKDGLPRSVFALLWSLVGCSRRWCSNTEDFSSSFSLRNRPRHWNEKDTIFCRKSGRNTQGKWRKSGERDIGQGRERGTVTRGCCFSNHYDDGDFVPSLLFFFFFSSFSLIFSWSGLIKGAQP